MKGIYSLEGVKPGDLYTKNGKDVWEVVSTCDYPTIQLRDLHTGATTGGGVGCLNVREFVRLVPADKP